MMICLFNILRFFLKPKYARRIDKSASKITGRLLLEVKEDLTLNRKLIQQSVLRCAHGIDAFNRLDKFWQKDLGECNGKLIKINSRIITKHLKKYGKETKKWN